MKKFNLFLIGIAILASFISYASLPATIPMHWNIAGDIDNWMSKLQAAIFFPGIIFVMWLLFQVVPKMDPNKDKYVLFEREWEIIQTTLLGFFLYLQLATFYISYHPDISMLPLLFTGLGVLFIIMGNYMSKIRQNYFIGIKVPWTLTNIDNWNKTHRFAGWTFVLAGIITLMAAFTTSISSVVVFAVIMFAAFSPIIYSFWIFRKQKI